MKFATKQNISATKVPEVSAEVAIEMLENLLAERNCPLTDEETAALESFEVDKSFTELAACDTVADALKDLTDTEKTELCSAWGCELKDVEGMELDAFVKKCYASQTGVAPASEEAVVVVALIYVVWIALLIAAAKAAEKCEQEMFLSIYRKLDTAFSDPKEAERALSEIVIVGINAKECDKQIKACKAVIEFFKMDVKKIFDPSFKIADIEKLAKDFYTTHTITFSNDNDYASAWVTWKDQLPEGKQDTLGGLGFTAKSLRDHSIEWSKLCKEFVTLPDIKKELAKAHTEKKADPGFWGRIVRWFRETKEQREDRRKEEVILFNKKIACESLIRGWASQVRFLSTFYYVAAHKADIIFKKNTVK